MEPDIAGLGSLVSLDATARDDKPVEGLPTRWVTATLSTGDVLGLNLTGSTGPTGTWQSTWPVRPGTDGERVVDFRGEDEGGQVGHGETALVIDTLLPGPPWMSSPRGTTWVGRPQVTVVGQGAPLGRLQLELDGAPAKSTNIDANGEWVIEQPLSESLHRLRTRLTDLAGNQSGFSNGATVKVDLEPPQVTLSAPPVSEGSFTVEWAGDDGDGSGVVAYQVEYQDNGGSWKTLLTETLELEAPFSGELYHEYTFRVRARDLVGHVSDWITTTVAIVNQTKYYFLDGRRVAMRKGDEVFYLYGDHLGSTSLTTDENGVKLSEDRYLPYGGGRLSDGISPTDFGFTDQRIESGLGLMDYNARYYDPFLGQFISPDPIIPDPANPQSWNRYSYVYNNPVRYTDPSGHCIFGLDTAICLYVGVALTLSGVALLASASHPLPPEKAPSFEQGMLGYGLLFGGAGMGYASQYTTRAAAAACADGDCGNEVQSGAHAVQQLSGPTTQQAAQYLNRVGRVRQTLNIGKGRNIAIADYNIEGVTREVVGVSGKAIRPGTVNPPAQRFFQTTVDKFPRSLDAEAKILENIAQQFAPKPGVYSDIQGTITLFTERPPCNSCLGVIQQFQQMFPNVTISILTGTPQ